MKEEIYLPKMGLTMTEASIEKWLKNDGDTVKKGEDILEIMTEKVTSTIEASASGVIKIHKKEGSTVPVGEVIGEIVDE